MLAAALLVVPAWVGVPLAVADPEDHVPYCSGDQTPMNNNCQYAPEQGYMSGAPGANPDTPLGLTPLDEPAI
ncbi:hypothetical protein ACQ86B_03415 [Mycolicibacterium aichiense]|uniref:hypothetical protein n=1 Tax=Mycolicibacterium aichiense TaxID=1799 RepID=UPI003D665A85